MKIALVGKAGSGKTTISNYLIDKYNFKPLKIAQPIYDIAIKYFKMNGKDRSLLQKIGNGVREVVDKDIWIKHLLKQSRDIKDNVVVDDCRFLNEFEHFKKDDWIIVGLKCPTSIRLQRMKKRDGSAQIETLNDISEKEMDLFIDKCDYFIDTSGSYDDNYIEVDKLMEILNDR